MSRSRFYRGLVQLNQVGLLSSERRQNNDDDNFLSPTKSVDGCERVNELNECTHP